MRTALIAGLAAMTVTGLASPAFAQGAAQADRADVRCVLMMELVARDPKNKEQAAKALYYYLGRLNARGPLSRLEPAMLSEAKAINSQQVAQAELSRCGSELNQRTTEFQALNQKLAAQARPAGAAPSAPPPKR